MIGLARADIDLDALADLPDDEIRERLTAIRGLGPWTAEWFLARHLARPRAWPAGDLGLRKAAETFYGLDVHELGPRLDPFQNLVRPLPADRPARRAARMNIRHATTADEAVLRELWEEFEREVPEPPGAAPETWEEEWADVRRDIDERRRLPRRGRRGRGRHRARDRAGARHARTSRIVYVRPRARRQGVAKALVQRVRRRT